MSPPCRRPEPSGIKPPRIRAWSRTGRFAATAVIATIALRTLGLATEIELGPSRNAGIPFPDIPIARWYPDGHIPASRSSSGWRMFWAGSTSYRTTGGTLKTMTLDPAAPVLAPGPGRDNGGAWLYAVIPRSSTHLIGFYHAEDHEWKTGRSAEGVAWKSVARCVSSDGGATWKKSGSIITSFHRKPDRPAWGGCGDHAVVFDPATRRWFCFFQEHFLSLAISDDLEGRPGTWKKWHRGAFSEPGLGGKSSPIPGLTRFPGGNPSVHFNTHLQCWVMVWHSWTGHLIWAHSSDLRHWSKPAVLLKARGRERFWYPTIIGHSDARAGESATLYYACWPDRNRNERRFQERSIRFIR